jgi:hypothetical protein
MRGISRTFVRRKSLGGEVADVVEVDQRHFA